MFGNAQQRARIKGLPFALTLADVSALLELGIWTCVYCGTPVGSFKAPMRPNSATLDRLNPERGYTTDNVVLACHRCNALKGEHTPESLRAWADKIENIIKRRVS